MHSSHYSSMTIHHNGDYSGDYIVVDVRRNEQGENISGNNYTEINISDKKFDSACKKLLKNNTFNTRDKIDFSLTGEGGTITVSSGEMVEFYLEKLRTTEIYTLEELTFKQLIKRYSK